MEDATVLIEVSGGVVAAAHSDNLDLRVVVVDWDTESAGDEEVQRLEDLDESSRQVLARCGIDLFD